MHSSASPTQERQELGVPVPSPIGELPLGSQEPYLRSHSRLGQTKSLAPCQGCGPPNGPFEVPSSRVGTQSRSACAAALCTYLEAQGDPAALGCPPAPCPRQKPAVSLHLWEEQMACDPARWSRQSWEAGPKTPQSWNRHPGPCWASQHPWQIDATIPTQRPDQRTAKAQWASYKDKFLPEHSRPLRLWPHRTYFPSVPGWHSSRLHPTCLL